MFAQRALALIKAEHVENQQVCRLQMSPSAGQMNRFAGPTESSP